MTIKDAFPNEFNVIRDIAQRTWPATYGHVLSAAQLDYMLQKGYSDEMLTSDYNQGTCFLLVEEGARFLAFAAFRHDFMEEGRTHIQKIYVLPEAQGKDIGRMLMRDMEKRATEEGARKMTLNVNRSNKARNFYARLGYAIVETIDIPIGNGYLMEDFVMEKKL